MLPCDVPGAYLTRRARSPRKHMSGCYALRAPLEAILSDSAESREGQRAPNDRRVNGT